MKKLAILIAVEQYSSPDINDVRYAKYDAEQFARVLTRHGFDMADQQLLVDKEATKQAIESQLLTTINCLCSNDILYVFFAGYGFSTSGRNFMGCYDSQDSNWSGTSVALQPIYKALQRATCAQIVLFFDCCRLEAPAVSSERREIHHNLQEIELKEFLDDAPHCLCFTACRSAESSYRSKVLKQGIWAFHLIEAFSGSGPIALTRGLLFASSLQKYLLAEVPRTLRKTYSVTYDQTPWMHGIEGERLCLADLRPILDERAGDANPSDERVSELTFLSTKVEPLRNLSGWKRSFRIPDRLNDATQRFVAQLSEHELKHDIDSIHDLLKVAFKFARRELDATGPADGAGTIITPYFNYSVSVSLNPDDPSEVNWTRTVNRIAAARKVASENFGQVFDYVFDTLQVSLPYLVNLEEFIDTVEAAEIPELKLQYDREVTHCDLEMEGVPAAVRLTPNELAIVHDRPCQTKLLIQSFDALRSRVLQDCIPLISFNTLTGK